MNLMKAKKRYLFTERQRDHLKQEINEIELNGKTKVVISDAGSKTARQRGLQWVWYGDVADSGMGGEHEDTKEGVHRLSKWRWAVPILLRDDEEFAEIWPELHRMFRSDQEKMKYIVDHFVSTEGDGFDMGEYLTRFERHYTSHGITLSDPVDWKLLQSRKDIDLNRGEK